jgi:hypothetical protein
VVNGLKEGDVVVASGTFLVDSESRMHSDTKVNSSSAMSATMPHMSDVAEHHEN